MHTLSLVSAVLVPLVGVARVVQQSPPVQARVVQDQHIPPVAQKLL